MFNEFVLSKHFSFEPQHYLDDSYIPIFAVMILYPGTLGVAVIEMWFAQQVLLMNIISVKLSKTFFGHLNGIQSLNTPVLKHGMTDERDTAK